jgi:hypothetical protein
MMKRRAVKSLLLALIVALLLSGLIVGGVALAVSQQNIDWWVMGAGGGPAQGGQFTLDGTIGQAVAGQNAPGGYDLCAGYWCGVKRTAATYLPMISSD